MALRRPHPPALRPPRARPRRSAEGVASQLPRRGPREMVEDRGQMARTITESAPAADKTAEKKAAQHLRTLAGPWGASFDGTDGKGHQTKGLTFERRWARPGTHPYDEIRWATRTATIATETGQHGFGQKAHEYPEFRWQLACSL